MKGYCGTVKSLIAAGCNKDPVDKNGLTPFHWAAQNDEYDVIKLLLESGVRKEVLTNDLESPLHFAAKQMGHPRLLELLLNSKLNVDSQDKNGMTPLHIASKYGNNEFSLMLVKAGCNKFTKDKFGKIPYDYAITSGKADKMTFLKPDIEQKRNLPARPSVPVPRGRIPKLAPGYSNPRSTFEKVNN